MEVIRYEKSLQHKWDTFVDESKNGSFLFKRNFMDYHADRFNDYSLMIFKHGILKAIIPANISPEGIHSHQGLSYGGIVIDRNLKLIETIDITNAILTYLKKEQISTLFLKLIPSIYHTLPSDEIFWILFKLNAEIYRRDTALVINNKQAKIPYQERRIRAIKKASKCNFEIRNGENELKPFWEEVLTPNLLQKHGVKPVHSLTEIEELTNKFPLNISQYNIYIDNIIVAGCTMFLNKKVAHAQYISGTQLGRDSGCLDFLFNHLIKNEFSNYDYFDFGICNENNGQAINYGLLDWKEGFGGRAICHDFYRIETKNHITL